MSADFREALNEAERLGAEGGRIVDTVEQKRRLKLILGGGSRDTDIALTLCGALRDGVIRVAEDVHPCVRDYLEMLADEVAGDQG